MLSSIRREYTIYDKLGEAGFELTIGSTRSETWFTDCSEGGHHSFATYIDAAAHAARIATSHAEEWLVDFDKTAALTHPSWTRWRVGNAWHQVAMHLTQSAADGTTISMRFNDEDLQLRRLTVGRESLVRGEGIWRHHLEVGEPQPLIGEVEIAEALTAIHAASSNSNTLLRVQFASGGYGFLEPHSGLTMTMIPDRITRWMDPGHSKRSEVEEHLDHFTG